MNKPIRCPICHSVGLVPNLIDYRDRLHRAWHAMRAHVEHPANRAEITSRDVLDLMDIFARMEGLTPMGSIIETGQDANAEIGKDKS